MPFNYPHTAVYHRSLTRLLVSLTYLHHKATFFLIFYLNFSYFHYFYTGFKMTLVKAFALLFLKVKGDIWLLALIFEITDNYNWANCHPRPVTEIATVQHQPVNWHCTHDKYFSINIICFRVEFSFKFSQINNSPKYSSCSQNVFNAGSNTLRSPLASLSCVWICSSFFLSIWVLASLSDWWQPAIRTQCGSGETTYTHFKALTCPPPHTHIYTPDMEHWMADWTTYHW